MVAIPTDLLTVIKAAPEFLKEVYGDLAKPATQEVGKALGTILGMGNTILIPLQLLNERSKVAVQKNLELYRQKLELFPQKEVIEVAPDIGVPILEKLTYVEDEQLANLYTSLLAAASSEKLCASAHPAFIKVIEFLSPDEARLIQYFGEQKSESYPILRIKRQIDPKTYSYKLGPWVTGLEREVNLRFPKNLMAYLSNLEGNGIINIDEDSWISNEELYTKLGLIYGITSLTDPMSLSPEQESHMRGKIDITSFGKLFIRGCVHN